MFVSLLEAKAHLRVLHDHEDVLILSLIDAAEQAAANYIDQPLEDLEDSPQSSPPEIPAPVKAAILMLVGELYVNRETQIVGVIIADNPVYERLLFPYRIGLGI